MPSGDAGFVALLSIHIISVIVWLGSAILLTYVVTPSIQKVSIATRKEFLLEALPRFAKLVKFSSIVALATGLALLGYVDSVDTNLFPSGLGLLLLLSGGVLGLVAFLVAIFAIVPSSAKLLKLLGNSGQTISQSGPLSELSKIQDTIRGGSRGVLVLLLIVVVLMIAGTYL